MKKTLSNKLKRWLLFAYVTILLFIWSLVEAGAATVTLSWDAVTDTSVTHICLYERTEGEQYDYLKPVTKLPSEETSVQVGVPEDDGFHYFVVRSYRESDGMYSTDSSEVSIAFERGKAILPYSEDLEVPILEISDAWSDHVYDTEAE